MGWHRLDDPKLLISLLVTLLLNCLFASSMILRSASGDNDWWDCNWSYRKKITISQDLVDLDLENFPVLVNIIDPDLTLKAQSNGDDIAFTDQNGIEQLDHEIESYSSSDGHLTAWVRLPTLSSTENTTFYMYYGNLLAPNQENMDGVWDSDYVMVHHMEDAFCILYDSTSYHNDGIGYGCTDTVGKIDGADDFNGVDSYYDTELTVIPEEVSFTTSTWVKAESFGRMQRIVSKDTLLEIGQFVLWDRGSGELIFQVRSDEGSWARASTPYPTENEWHHLVGVWNHTSREVKLYLDGALKDTVMATDDETNAGSIAVTIGAAAMSGQYWNGSLDEIRISLASRSPDWIMTSYRNQENPSGFYTVQLEETNCPTVSIPDPSDGATGVPISIPDLSFNLSDIDGNMDYIVSTSPCCGNDSKYDVPAGRYKLPVSNLDFNTTYNWHVNVTDGATWTNVTYSFTTQSQPAEFSVDPPLTEMTHGEIWTTFEVNVTIKNVEDFFGFDFNMTWNNTLITVENVDFTSALDNIWGLGNWFVAKNETGQNWFKLVAVAVSAGFNSTGKTTIATLTFHVENVSSGKTPLHFTVVKISNSKAQPIFTEVSDGLYTMWKPQLYVDPPLVEKVPNDLFTAFTVNVTVEKILDLRGFDFNLTWDFSLITLSSVDYSTLDALWGEGNWIVTKSESGLGWYKLVALSTVAGSNSTVAHTLVRLTFQVVELNNYEAETELDFEVAKLSDSEAQPINTNTTDGLYRMLPLKPRIRLHPVNRTCRKYCEYLNMSFSIENAITVEGFTFQLKYNKTLLDFVNGSEVWGALGQGMLIVNETTGTIHGTVNSSSSISGSQWLLNVTFNATFLHVWHDESQDLNWKNTQTGRVWFHWVNLTYPDHDDLRYEEGGHYQIEVSEITYTFSPIQGDVDNDGDVDVFDLRIVGYYYDLTSDDPDWTDASRYDLNGDNTIDIFDLQLVAANYDYTYDC